ncbi:unnamed protein product [Lactuca virosa]|uniref:Uncharacterized protein n=1 Tax=Lactuca virosa TaxID=75947 RepID=A0AAU9PGG3_9ASTR|nr:unnamed protein product [Lactuca virosa]
MKGPSWSEMNKVAGYSQKQNRSGENRCKSGGIGSRSRGIESRSREVEDEHKSEGVEEDICGDTCVRRAEIRKIKLNDQTILRPSSILTEPHHDVIIAKQIIEERTAKLKKQEASTTYLQAFAEISGGFYQLMPPLSLLSDITTQLRCCH